MKRYDLTFFEKFTEIIAHPNEFFKWLNSNHDIEEASKFLLGIAYIASGITGLIGIGLAIIFGSLILAAIPALPSSGLFIIIGLIIIYSAISPLFSLLSLFISAAIIHLFVIILGGSDYSKTFNIMSYSSVPAFFGVFFMFLPIIGGFLSLPFSIWAFVLNFKGIMKLHNFSFGRTLAVYAIPFGIMLTFFSIFVIILLVISAAG